MHSKKLHLIEPTLTKLSGHEYGYIANLVSANNNFAFDMHIWLGKKADWQNIINKLLNINNKSITIHNFFIRSFRQLQKVFLYYKLLKNNQVIYVCTSGLFDLVLCDLLCKLFNFDRKTAFFHFHQFTKTAKKINKLNKFSLQAKHDFKILTTTNNLANIFINSNFIKVKTINYPGILYANITNNLEEFSYHFSKILYAGVARTDKGFSLVVDTIEDMQAKQMHLPFAVQAAPPISNRYDNNILLSLEKLQKIADLNSNIIMYKSALNTEQYQKLFQGAICLLLYDQNTFVYRISGVSFDAIYHGAPIITVGNTSMGDVIKHFDAGIVLKELNINNIIEAILAIKKQYEYYHNNAKQTAKYLINIHDPKHTLQVIYDYL